MQDSHSCDWGSNPHSSILFSCFSIYLNERVFPHHFTGIAVDILKEIAAGSSSFMVYTLDSYGLYYAFNRTPRIRW
jgi:hypothetical protein